ncbi:MAG: hypothetical protein AB7S38_33370 [Vulcanimicrobiota bacterium]
MENKLCPTCGGSKQVRVDFTPTPVWRACPACRNRRRTTQATRPKEKSA